MSQHAPVRRLVHTNTWNRIRYTAWAPFYDVVGGRFDGYRRASIARLQLAPTERVLLVGAGTGADLRLIPSGVTAVATDLTPAMLARARRHRAPDVHFAIMDGHRLAARTAAFDAVVLHLILAVIPDPVRCLQEAARVLRPQGRIVVFDKFARSRPPIGLQLLNVVSAVLFTDVTRRFEDILGGTGSPLTVDSDEPAALGGLFRYIVLRAAGLDGNREPGGGEGLVNRVIFACVHNAGRSQIAAAFFNQLADPTEARAISAGTQPGDRVHPEVLETMREVGIDLEKAKPQRLTTEVAAGASHLVTMGCGEECPFVPGAKVQDWPLEDPKGKPVERVREIRDEVRRRVEEMIESNGWVRRTR
jgi:arsenate reductase (thioredoxin)